MIKPYLNKVIQKQNLTENEAEEAMDIIMSGNATPAQIGGYLVALRMKGETISEIVGSSRSMKKNSVPLYSNKSGENIFDTAGTGGDGSHSFNVSTTSAFIIAGAGKKVAKHGNRAASSMCGSADVLVASGVNIDIEPAQVAECIDRIGIGFLFAPRFHPAMKHAIGPRRELGQRTIFNLLGPLTNPAGATHQLVGVFDPSLTSILAEVLGELGGKSAFVVHGFGGLDELTTSGVNIVSYMCDRQTTTFEFDTREYGLRKIRTEHLTGGTPENNALIMRNILNGKDKSPRRDIVLLNAAMALATESGEFISGLISARASLDEGAALEKFDNLIEFSQSLSASGKHLSQ
jgi:anthranilate phosphoribosyltransferase